MSGNGTKYNQIANYYKHLIESDALKDGDKLPSEAEISALFRASRITVRRAMEEIVKDGCLERIQGKGSFVRKMKQDMQLNHLRGFTEEMKAKGLLVSSQVLSVGMESCTPQIAKHLEIESYSQVLSIQRLRLIEKEPVAFEHVFIPFHLYPELSKKDLSGSLYALLAENGLTVSRASQSISAGFASPKVRELLKVNPKTPMLIIERVTFQEDNTPLEYVLSTYRSDRYTFHVDMSR